VAVAAANRTASVAAAAAAAETVPNQNHLAIQQRSTGAQAAEPVAVGIDQKLIRLTGASNPLQVAAALMKG